MGELMLPSQQFDRLARPEDQCTEHRSSEVRLQLLGGFALVVDGESVPVGLCCQRLLRFLAFCGQQNRSVVAGILWPDVTKSRANANLRSAMWRFQRANPRVLAISGATVGLMPDVVVDIQLWARTAQRLMNLATPMDHEELVSAVSWCMKTDLVPEIDDDEWYAPVRERYRQLGMHALEALAFRLVRAGWFGAAVDVALAAVRVDPLRESARRALVEAYLAEGNLSEAQREYHYYRALLSRELGVAPSRMFDALLDLDRNSRSAGRGYGAELRSGHPALVDHR